MYYKELYKWTRKKIIVVHFLTLLHFGKSVLHFRENFVKEIFSRYTVHFILKERPENNSNVCVFLVCSQ